MLTPAKILVPLAACAVLLAGCGSSKPTQSQYAAKADAVCRQTSARTTALVKELAAAAASLGSNGQTAARELAGALQSLHAAADSSLAKLKALQQPQSGQATIRQFLSSYGAVDEAVGAAARAAEGGQPQQALARLQAAQPAAERMAAAAKSAGMSSCETLLPTLGATAAEGIQVTIVGESHHPSVGKRWAYTVTVTNGRGEKLSGTETTHYLFSGAVVGTEKPANVPFSDGRYRDTIVFPADAVGHPLEVEAVVDTGQGSGTARWSIEVLG